MTGRSETVRRLLMAATVVMTTVYLGYRGLYTLNCESIYATFASLSLFLAECYGSFLMFLYFFSIWKIIEPEPVEPLAGRKVDVYIPTYNEDPELLRGTIVAALALDYPHETYVLDDGRRPEVRELAERLGANYLDRPDNSHAKAGNLNHAMGITEGEFIVIFDADHVAQRNFITRLLGYFADDRLAFIQTPHSFYNFDNFQGTLDYSRNVYWEEGQLFYNVIQPGKNYWNAVSFCGSAAMFRRTALDDVGGVATETITEDMQTGIRLHGRGWKSLFVNERLVSGQAATDITTFNTQRLRWGEGNLSIFAHDNPLTMPGLTISQRLSYLGAMLSWTTGLQKLLLYLAPVMMLITNVAPVRDFNLTLGLITVVYLLTVWTTVKVVSNGYGHLLGTELTHMACFWTQIRATYRAVFKRRFARFVVTSKRGRQNNRMIYHISPQCLYIAVSAIAAACASLRWWFGFSDDVAGVAIGSALVFFHCWFAWNVVRRALRTKDLRHSWRHPAAVHVAYDYVDRDGRARRGQAVSVDVNERGVGVVALDDLSQIDHVHVTLTAGGRTAQADAHVRLVRPVLSEAESADEAAQAWRVGFSFDEPSEETLAAVWWMAATYSVSRQYDRFQSVSGHAGLRSVHAAITREADDRQDLQLPVTITCDTSKDTPVKRRYAVSERLDRKTVNVLVGRPLPAGKPCSLTLGTPFGEVRGRGVSEEPSPVRLCAEDYAFQAFHFEPIDAASEEALRRTLGKQSSDDLEEILRFSPDESALPAVRPGALLGATGAIAATLAIALNLWLLRDEILLARALASGRVTPTELVMLNEMAAEVLEDSAPEEERVLRLREVMRLTGHEAGVRVLDEFLVEADFKSFYGRLTSAQAFADLGRHEQAAVLLEGLMEGREAITEPDRLRDLLATSARNLACLGQNEQARTLLEELVATSADPAAYRREHAGVLAALGEFGEVRRLLMDDEATDDDRRYYGSLLSVNGRFLDAAHVYTDLSSDAPDDTELLRLAAENAMGAGRLDAAAALYQRLLSQDEDNSAARLGFARACLWSDRPDPAMPLLTRVVADGAPTDEELNLFLSGVAACSATDATQRRLVRAAFNDRELRLGDPDFVRALADAMARLDENRVTIPILKSIVASDAGDRPVRLRLAQALRDEGLYSEAESHFLRLLEDDSLTQASPRISGISRSETPAG